MEIIQSKDNNDDYYINRTIMVPENDGLNSFYKVINHTDKMFCIRKIKTETNLYKTNFDEITNEATKVYQAKLSDDFENENIKKIRKTSIHKYSVIYCSLVQYEV
jgi:hypothetical protein